MATPAFQVQVRMDGLAKLSHQDFAYNKTRTCFKDNDTDEADLDSEII